MKKLIVTDGPNLYNDVVRYLTRTTEGGADNQTLKKYLREWFDIDRLVESTIRQSLTPNDLGLVVFHSRYAMGEGDFKISGDDAVRKFWARQGSNPNSAVQLVDIPDGPKGKEKGVDTSIVVYMFETLNQWDAAYLFTNDTDFVPAVWSLRRQGKRVFAASHTDDRSTPLVQASQDFFPWDADFLKADLELFEVLQPGAELDEFMAATNSKVGTSTISVSGQKLIFTPRRPHYDQNDVNRFTSIFRGRSYRGTTSGQKLVVVPSLVVGNAPVTMPSGTNLFRGLLRHKSTFASANWAKQFVVSPGQPL